MPGRRKAQRSPSRPYSPVVPDRPLAVFDLDGVLADVDHRVHLLHRQPPAWDAFFRAAAADPVLPEGQELVLEAARDCDVLYLTGRPERCRADSVRWLSRHGLPDGRMVMRADRDRRPAAVAKPGWLADAARGRIVAVVVDDDPAVCSAYRKAGWPVLWATWADRSPELQQAQDTEGRS